MTFVGMKYQCREAKRNDLMLFGIIKEKARVQHKYHVIAQEQKVKSNFSKKDKTTDRSVVLEIPREL
ncbi:hypothetical protein PI125_g22925 [Phytophthora idaei]|nr:hypothetical protein PI125_g22925 [Phytophthora idaei]KAG3130985.1 hypothetical protein PI126_g20255 [Phytophthora idaei]